MKRHGSRRSKKIAIAPLAGMLLGLIPLIMTMKEGYEAGEAAAPGGGMKMMMTYAMDSLTGLAVDPATQKWRWNFASLQHGLIPLLVGAFGGLAIHKLANKSGINRNIPWFSI